MVGLDVSDWGLCECLGQKLDLQICHLYKHSIEKLVNAEELSKDLLNLLYFNCSFYFTVLKYKGLLYHTSESSKDYLRDI